MLPRPTINWLYTLFCYSKVGLQGPSHYLGSHISLSDTLGSPLLLMKWLDCTVLIYTCRVFEGLQQLQNLSHITSDHVVPVRRANFYRGYPQDSLMD